MIVQNLKKPFDLQSQREDLWYYGTTSFVLTDWPSKIEECFKETYAPVGPTMLTEWEKEE